MHSITWRLVRWYTCILALILVICGSSAFISMRYLLYKEAVREAAAAIVTVKKLASPSEENLDAPEITVSVDNNDLWIQIIASNGELINSSSALKNIAIKPAYVGPPIIYHMRRQRVFLAGAKLTKGYLVQIVRPLSREEEFLRFLASVFGLLVLAGLILAIIGGWLITRAALHPIQNLTKTAHSISTTDLSRRIILNGPHDELYQLGETFNQMLDRLEQGFKSQQEFLNAASHDLRTPLAIIRSYFDILNRWGKDEPAVIEESLPAIAKAIAIMERLVNDLLLLAKMQSQPSLKFVPVALHELAEEVVREAQAITENITVTFNESVPVVIEADEVYLHRALWILVDNAIKYNHPGGAVSISVGMTAQEEGRLVVSDTGSGISPDELPKIFDRFYRGDFSRSLGKGFGLGLALAKNIIEAHGGRIEVASQMGQGSKFSIILPLKSL